MHQCLVGAGKEDQEQGRVPRVGLPRVQAVFEGSGYCWVQASLEVCASCWVGAGTSPEEYEQGVPQVRISMKVLEDYARGRAGDGRGPVLISRTADGWVTRAWRARAPCSPSFAASLWLNPAGQHSLARSPYALGLSLAVASLPGSVRWLARSLWQHCLAAFARWLACCDSTALQRSLARSLAVAALPGSSLAGSLAVSALLGGSLSGSLAVTALLGGPLARSLAVAALLGSVRSLARLL
jgi:hypothetical protein